jgi:hypothetical protein
MKMGQDEFFAIIGEGAALLKNLDEGSSGFFDDLNRLREILAMIGVASAGAPLDFALADKERSAKVLFDYVANGIRILPPELAAFEAQTVGDLAHLIGNNTVSEAAWEFVAAGKYDPRDAEAKLAVFGNIAARGVKHGIEQAALEKALTDSQELLAQKMADDPEYAAARAHYDQLSAERTKAIRELSDRVAAATEEIRDAVRDGRDEAEIAPLRDAREVLARQLDDLYNDTHGAQTEAWERVKATSAQFNETRASTYRALFEENGQKIIDAVVAASPITPEQAQAWAAEQIIDANAKAKLKKLGYKPEDVVRDMAEFYRLTGGKASAIRIGIDGGKRANAVGITDRLGEKVINLGSRFNKTVLFHELAHHLENDPIAKGASNGFLLKRREGEGVYRLRDLTKNKGYDKSEIAYKDHFTDAYVGKVYKDGVTEVFSMGVQYLANPKDAAIFAAQDPEMFALITGYLSMPVTPAMHAKLNMHKGVIGQMLDERQEVEAQYERAIEFLSSQAALVNDDWPNTLDRDGEFYEMLTRYVLTKSRKGVAQYVGGHGRYKVFSGVFHNWATKRNAKGFLIVDALSTENADRASTGGWRKVIPDSMILHSDLDKVRALIAVANLEGNDLTSAWRYFNDNHVGNAKKRLIARVGTENLQ